MKIIITGCAGFIGYHLCQSLIKNGHDILGIDNINTYYDQKLKLSRLKNLKTSANFKFEKTNINELNELKKNFKNFKPQKVVNLAAQAGVRYSLINPHAYVESNLVGFVNVIELCHQFNIESLIYASSSSVYGNGKDLPYKIEDDTNQPISLYGATKKANEVIAHSYSQLYDLKTIGLRYFTVYGSWYRPDMALYIFAKKIINNEEIKVFNHGKMKRDFTYIDDIIKGTISALESDYKNEIFNLGNSKSEELMDVIKIIEDELKIKAKINFEPNQPGDVIETYADIRHSINKLNYNPKINIEVGIPKFIKWFREYYNV